MRGPVLCDRCGQPIAHLADARLATRYDGVGRVTALMLDHAGCVIAIRQELDDGGDETLVDRPAAELLETDRQGSLRRSARTRWASASRVIARVKRLGALAVPRRMGPEVRRWAAPAKGGVTR